MNFVILSGVKMFEMIIVAFLMDGGAVVQKESFSRIEDCEKELKRAYLFVSQIESSSFKGASFQCIGNDQKVIIEKFFNVMKGNISD